MALNTGFPILDCASTYDPNDPYGGECVPNLCNYGEISKSSISTTFPGHLEDPTLYKCWVKTDIFETIDQYYWQTGNYIPPTSTPESVGLPVWKYKTEFNQLPADIEVCYPTAETIWTFLYELNGYDYWERKIIQKDIYIAFWYEENYAGCPSGTVYDPIFDACVLLPGFIYDPITGEIVSACERSVCFYLPDSPAAPICVGDFSGIITVDPNIQEICEDSGPITLFFEYKERYTDGLPISEGRFIYNAPQKIIIEDVTKPVLFEIESINANGRCGEIIVTAISSNGMYYQCGELIIDVCCPGSGSSSGSSCCPNLFDDKFKLWKDCGGFAEPQYVGNVLKDGTILED